MTPSPQLLQPSRYFYMKLEVVLESTTALLTGNACRLDRHFIGVLVRFIPKLQPFPTQRGMPHVTSGNAANSSTETQVTRQETPLGTSPR